MRQPLGKNSTLVCLNQYIVYSILLFFLQMPSLACCKERKSDTERAERAELKREFDKWLELIL